MMMMTTMNDNDNKNFKKKNYKKKNFKKFKSFSRYGREDEELMGLRFCNEVIVAGTKIVF